MSAALSVERGTDILSEAQIVKDVKDLIREARADRRRFEPTWQSNLAFAAGKFYLQWDRDQRRLVMPPELAGKNLYSPDVITEYRMTALGELGADDDRPELLLRHDDRAAEEFQSALNRAVGYGWDEEWDGDTQLEQARRLCVDIGTSAVQCSWEADAGPVIGEVPHLNGKPVYDTAKASELLGNGPNPAVKMGNVRQGRISWRPLSAFNLLVPPGVPEEARFPWECVVDCVLLTDAQAEYGDLAVGLREDTDIGSLLGLDTSSEMIEGRGHGLNWNDSGNPGRVRNQIWRFRYFERPSREWPNGRVLTFLGNKMKLVKFDDKLPYQAPDGTHRSGIAYFHWQRVSGRFWSRSLVEPMKDIQRAIWKLATQRVEIIDRGMPFVLVDEKQPQLINRKGTPVEVIPIKGQQTGPPVVHSGIGPGDWMFKQMESLREDLEHATGLRGPRLGDNPANVGTYSQLALINENEGIKREPIHRDHKRAIAQLVEDSVFDMRTYWGPKRTVQLAGDENRIEAEIFDATKIPTFFIVKVAKGAAKPRTQAAMLKLVEDVYTYSLNSRQPVPPRWVLDSLQAGQPLDLPEQPSDAHAEKAEVENHKLFGGEQPPVAYYDPPEVHVPVHREAQIQAEESGDTMAVLRIEKHIQDHLAEAQGNAAMLAQTAAPAAVGLQAAQADIQQGQQAAAAQQQQAAQPPAPGT